MSNHSRGTLSLSAAAVGLSLALVALFIVCAVDRLVYECRASVAAGVDRGNTVQRRVRSHSRRYLRPRLQSHRHAKPLEQSWPLRTTALSMEAGCNPVRGTPRNPCL